MSRVQFLVIVLLQLVILARLETTGGNFQEEMSSQLGALKSGLNSVEAEVEGNQKALGDIELALDNIQLAIAAFCN